MGQGKTPKETLLEKWKKPRAEQQRRNPSPRTDRRAVGVVCKLKKDNTFITSTVQMLENIMCLNIRRRSRWLQLDVNNPIKAWHVFRLITSRREIQGVDQVLEVVKMANL